MRVAEDRIGDLPRDIGFLSLGGEANRYYNRIKR